MSVTLPNGGPTITVNVAFSSTPFATSPSWTDITQYVRSVKIHRGRSRELDAFSAGTCSVVLSNADRRFDPEYSSSPYSGGLLPMKKIQIVSNYSATTSYLFTGYVDGWPQTYIEQNDSVVNVSATDGFKVLEMVDLPGSLYEFAVASDKPDHWWKLDEASGTVAYDSGFAPVLYNGRYSESPTLGTAGIVSYDGSSTCVAFTASQYVQIPGNAMGSAADYSVSGWFSHSTIGSSVQAILTFGSSPGQSLPSIIVADPGKLQVGGGPVSTARVDDGVAHHFVAVRSGNTTSLYVDGTLNASGNAGATALATTPDSAIALNVGSGISFKGSIAQVSFWIGTTLSSTQIASHYAAGKTAAIEGTGTRIGRVLDFAGIPTSDRSIDTGSTTLPALDLSSQSALSYCNLLSQSERGAFFFAGNGKATFLSRFAIQSDTASRVVNCTFSDAAGGITYNDFTTQYDDQDINNEARVAASGGVTQFASDTTSQASYGRRTFSLSGLLTSNNEAQARAQFEVSLRKDPQFRVKTLTIKPHAAPTQTWPQVLQRELIDRIAVVRTPQGTGSAITKNVLIQSITHDFGADLDWTTTYELAPANVETQYMIWNDAVTGIWNTGKWAY